MQLNIIEAISGLFKENKNLIKDAIYVNALRILQILLGLITTYFLVRSLSRESFGEYHFVFTCIGVLTVFTLPGLNNSLMQTIARGFFGTYRKTVAISFACAHLGTAILFLLSYWCFLHTNHQLAYAFFIGAILFPMAHGLNQWKSVSIGMQKFQTYFKQQALVYLIVYPLIIVSLYIMPGSYLLPLTCTLIVPAFLNLFFSLSNYRKIPPDGPLEEDSISYGIKISFYSVINILATHIDKLLLFGFLSPIALATFVVANRIADLFRSLVQDGAVVLAPRFAKTNYTKKLNTYLKIFVFLYGVTLVIFAFTILPWLMLLIFGNAYSDAIPYGQALLCSLAIENLAILQFRFIRSRMDADSFRNIIVFTSLARILLSIVLIPVWGLVGAVIAVFLYRIVFAVTIHIIMKLNYPVQQEG